jgi:adenine/guanine phosphoribosyltransferase-like PRPP-binding protein
LEPHDFWQAIEPAADFDASRVPSGAYAAAFDDGRRLLLPIRPLGGGEHALASLILNQASFAVVEAIAADLAGKLAPFRPAIIVGLPTLGLTLASAVARKLGHSRYVPLGISRKFWYREELSVPLSSITTPDQRKRLYADPRMLPLLSDRSVALVDDVISSGASISAALDLMARCEIEPAVIGAAMLQSDRWRDRLGPQWRERTTAVLRSPMLSRTADGGWIDAAETVGMGSP